ncbi:pantoate--beta-alanine ligase [Mesorhizobium helmanticense]|uniref:pantoate--beta-alanine ligase n=1 Tax=Mesorhizobium helmanticense TaxID=1776423 RepID=UPI00142DFF44|nr:pantoate--beta-alanine ligase [Mesorhizobium helmanticense]
MTKLFLQTAPSAFFGEKDFQQLQVPRLARDLDIPIGIIAFQTRREADGLVMSSRNCQAVGRTAQRMAAPKRNSLGAAERLAAMRSCIRRGDAILATGYRDVEYLELRAGAERRAAPPHRRRSEPNQRTLDLSQLFASLAMSRPDILKVDIRFRDS